MDIHIYLKVFSFLCLAHIIFSCPLPYRNQNNNYGGSYGCQQSGGNNNIQVTKLRDGVALDLFGNKVRRIRIRTKGNVESTENDPANNNAQEVRTDLKDSYTQNSDQTINCCYNQVPCSRCTNPSSRLRISIIRPNESSPEESSSSEETSSDKSTSEESSEETSSDESSSDESSDESSSEESSDESCSDESSSEESSEETSTDESSSDESSDESSSDESSSEESSDESSSEESSEETSSEESSSDESSDESSSNESSSEDSSDESSSNESSSEESSDESSSDESSSDESSEESSSDESSSEKSSEETSSDSSTSSEENDDESGERTVCVLLAGEESDITFLDSPPDNIMSDSIAHGYCVVYSTADRGSFAEAEKRLQTLWAAGHTSRRAVILVGNKADLARSRVVPTDEGKGLATSYECKFIETSVGINHNVDELLVGLLTQIRLKQQHAERVRKRTGSRKNRSRNKSPLDTERAKERDEPPTSAASTPRKRTRLSASVKFQFEGLVIRNP